MPFGLAGNSLHTLHSGLDGADFNILIFSVIAKNLESKDKYLITEYNYGTRNHQHW